jgi:hypothetical protein
VNTPLIIVSIPTTNKITTSKDMVVKNVTPEKARPWTESVTAIAPKAI